MYILDFLAGKYGGSANAVVSEYRLLCSGELYNSSVQTFDWRKSYVSRQLLLHPCSLQVVSQPFDDFPQELALLLSAPESVTESTGNVSSTFPPDDYIAQDLSVLLTVLLRRLVSVYVKVQRRYPRNPLSPEREPAQFDERLPIVSAGTRIAWKRKPVSIGRGLRGVESFTDHNPAPLEVSPSQLASRLTAVGRIRHGDTFVLACRLYTQAMRMIEEWPDVAYQLLVYCVETVANEALSNYLPSRKDMVSAKEGVAKRVEKHGLTRDQAEDVAVVACSGMPWAARKFQMFLDSARNEIDSADDLFRLSESMAPAAADFDKALRNIYNSRSALVHRGQSYSASVGLGTTAYVPIDALNELLTGTQQVPPVAWFERVVNVALNHYLHFETELHEQVRRRAYELFQHRGGQHGHDLDDWLKGEAEIDASAAKSK